MSTSYSGTPSNVVAGQNLAVTIPQEGDVNSAASINGAIQRLADLVERMWRAERLRPLSSVFKCAADPSVGTLTAVGACNSENRLLALGTGTTPIAYSDNQGQSWSSATVPGSATINATHEQGGMVVAVGNSGTIWTSADYGANWTSRTSGVAGNLTTVTYDSTAGKWVAAGVDAVRYSTDGITWSDGKPSVTGTPTFAVCSSGGTYVLFATSGASATQHCWSSTNGTSWTHRAITSATQAMVAPRVYTVGGARLFMGWFFLSGSTYNFYTSADGITWTLRINGSSSNVSDTLFTGDVLFQPADSPARYSYDGTTWTTIRRWPLSIVAGKCIHLSRYKQVVGLLGSTSIGYTAAEGIA